MSAKALRCAVPCLLALYVAFLALILLCPSASVPNESVSFVDRMVQRVGVSSSLASPSRVEFVSNVLIFIPFSLLASIRWPCLNWRDWTAVGFVVASSVELLQGIFLPARSASFADLVANTFGALLGAASYRLLIVRYERFLR